MNNEKLAAQLREYADNSGYSHNDYADTMREAAERLAPTARDAGTIDGPTIYEFSAFENNERQQYYRKDEADQHVAAAVEAAEQRTTARVQHLTHERDIARRAADDLSNYLEQRDAELAKLRSTAGVGDAVPQGWEVRHCLPDSTMTDDWNNRFRYTVARIAPPFCSQNGNRIWNGPTLNEAITAGCAALDLPVAATAPVSAAPTASAGALLAALRKYGTHLHTCGCVDGGEIDPSLEEYCDCGLNELMQSTGAPVSAAHPDDLAVDGFADAMKAKMAASREKGRGGWMRPEICPADRLRAMLVEHVAKGDPVDVGNFAMMLWNRGESTAAPVSAVPAGDGERAKFEAWHRSKFVTKHSTGQPTRDMHNGIYAEKYGPKHEQQMWEAWQARAALPPSSGAPVSVETSSPPEFLKWWEANSDRLYDKEVEDIARISWKEGRAPVSAAEQVRPTAEEYSDMLREFFCRYSAGGYNSEGLVSIKSAESKLEWIAEDQRQSAAWIAARAQQAKGTPADGQELPALPVKPWQVRAEEGDQDKLTADQCMQLAEAEIADLRAALAMPQPQGEAMMLITHMVEAWDNEELRGDEYSEEILRIETGMRALAAKQAGKEAS